MRLENFFTAYKKDLIARHEQVKESILNGMAKDWSEYILSRAKRGKKVGKLINIERLTEEVKSTAE